MATRMWLMWLIAIGLLFFTSAKADSDIFKSESWNPAEEFLEIAIEEGNKFYSRVSPAYEKWDNGEMSESEFWEKVGKSVVRGGCSFGGSAAGAYVGGVWRGPVGAKVGRIIVGKLGNKIGDYVTGETD
ncbi:hypothetical protein Bbelb_104710 [Branchiostoma belcheri]|nr:hypothetical protein Bbelb_104710 [Branchiostoma belcheri]